MLQDANIATTIQFSNGEELFLCLHVFLEISQPHDIDTWDVYGWERQEIQLFYSLHDAIS